jgi:predicted ATP-dependent serine protease
MPRTVVAPIASEDRFLKVKSLPWLNDALGGGFAKGGVYLLAGQEGAGKSTLILRWTPLARPRIDDPLLLSHQPFPAVVAR